MSFLGGAVESRPNVMVGRSQAAQTTVCLGRLGKAFSVKYGENAAIVELAEKKWALS